MFYAGAEVDRERSHPLMGPLLLAIAVVLCTAYLLWQILEADLIRDP
jgi:hypothetical protein